MSHKETKERNSAKNREKSRQWSFSSSSPSSHRSNSPDPGSAIASLVLASSFSPSTNSSSPSEERKKSEARSKSEGKKEEEKKKETHVKHQVQLWNRNHYSLEERESDEEEERRMKEEGRKLSQDQERKKKEGGERRNYNNMTDANISSTVLDSGFEPSASSSQSFTAHSRERKSEQEIEEGKKEEEGKKKEVIHEEENKQEPEIQSLDSSSTVTFSSSSSSSSSSARGTLSSPSLKEKEEREKEEQRNREKEEQRKSKSPRKLAQEIRNEMKNPFKSKKDQSSDNNSVGQALANVLTGGSGTIGSITSMDTLDPMTAAASGTGASGGSGSSPTSTSAINPILAKEARTRSFLVGNLGCHDGILGCEELTRFFPSGKVNIMIITWNMSGNSPPSELNDLLLPETLLYVPDIYAIALQEMVFGEGKEIETQLQTTIGPSHVLLHSHIHGVLGLLIFVRRDLIWFFSLPEESAYNVRPASMNMVKTKGAVGVSFSFFGTTFLFINSHLPAHEARNKERREAYEKIISSFDLPRNLKPLKPRYISSDVTARFDVCFWFGDLNFRIERGYEETIQILEEIKAQKEFAKSGCCETGRIKRILGGRLLNNNSIGSTSQIPGGSNLGSTSQIPGGNLGGKNNEISASNASLQGSVSSTDSTGLADVSNVSNVGATGHSPSNQSAIGIASQSNSSKLLRRISEPGTSSSGHRSSESPKNSETHSLENCYECLLRTDQLLKGMEERTLFNGFQEVSEITFAPTFKYDINGDGFDVEYHRVPSYTDRILTRSKRPGHVTCIAYDSIPDIKTSDHKPVFALMECQIRPGKDTIPLNAGLFKRDVYIEALRRRAEENFGTPGGQASNCGVS